MGGGGRGCPPAYAPGFDDDCFINELRSSFIGVLLLLVGAVSHAFLSGR